MSRSSTPSTSAQGPALNPLALEALENNQRQLDMDGVEVGVSRQALDEVLAAYKAAVERINRATDAEIGGIQRSFAASPSPAASPASPSEVRVKPLEWIGLSDSCIAHTPFGVYKVAQAGETVNMFIARSELPKSFHATLDEAKAAAQADYEARILSALASDATPAPTSGSEDGGDWRPVLTEMVAAMNRYGHEIGDGDIPSAHRSLMWRAEQLLAKPASEPAGGGVDANGVDMTAVEGTLGAAKKAGIVVSFNDVWAIVTLYRAALSSSAGPAVEAIEQWQWAGCGHSAWFDGQPPFGTHPDEIEKRSLYAHPAPATVEMLREAARDLIASRSSTYKAKNGRVMGIEDDAGEMMWIVPFDEMAALEAALAPATEGRKS